MREPIAVDFAGEWDTLLAKAAEKVSEATEVWGPKTMVGLPDGTWANAPGGPNAWDRAMVRAVFDALLEHTVGQRVA